MKGGAAQRGAIEADDDDIVLRVTNAALACVARNGFDRTTIDNIVQESGVSRTTIYRHFGNRDEILRAMLMRLALPHQERCAIVAAGSGSWIERLGRVVAMSVGYMDEYPWLKAVLRDGLSESSLALFVSVSGSMGGNVIRSMLFARQEEGGWPRHVTIEEVMNWLLRHILFLGSRDAPDAKEIDHYITVFMIPVLAALGTGHIIDASIEGRLGKLERSVERLFTGGGGGG